MTARKPSKRKSPVKKIETKQLTQSTLFSSKLFNGKHDEDEQRKEEIFIEISEGSDLELIDGSQELEESSVQTDVKEEPVLGDVIPVSVKEEADDAKSDCILVIPGGECDEIGAVSCPICGLNIDRLSLNDRNVHVDDCFNFGIASNGGANGGNGCGVVPEKFEVETASGYIYKSMKETQKVDTNGGGDQAQVGIKSETAMKRVAVEENGDGEAQVVQVQEKKVRREKNPVPELKIMDFKDHDNNILSKLAMDAFCYKEHPEIQHYFLSHFHSDHYMGISKSWNHGHIFCSLITKKLLMMRFKVPEEIITAVPFYEPMIVPDTQVRVTALDANHCPGSAIFLYENMVTGKKKLHCGDFRINKKMICDALLNGIEIDDCYLDTTYLNPVYAFPKQEHVISVVSEFCERLVKGEYSGRKVQKRVTDFFDNTILRKDRKNYLICVGTYTIGKERIAIDIAKKLGVKLYANVTKRDILSTFDWEELNDLITSDPFETQVHLIPMSYLNTDSLESYYKPYKSHFQNIIAFKPTGWSFISNDSTKWMSELAKEQILLQICRDTENDARFNLEKIEKQFKSDRVIQVYGVPYSEHSSFRELSFFCILLKFKRIIPTVNVHNLASIHEMEEWIKEWQAVKNLNILNIDLL